MIKPDIEIARDIKLTKIKKIAAGIGTPEEEEHNYGKYIAKIPYHLINEEMIKKHHLILGTAITRTEHNIHAWPTPKSMA